MLRDVWQLDQNRILKDEDEISKFASSLESRVCSPAVVSTSRQDLNNLSQAMCGEKCGEVLRSNDDLLVPGPKNDMHMASG
jgi:hypothetical protein